MIITLKVNYYTYWSAEIEFDEFSTLDEVHDTLQQVLNFENDHLYAFFVARNQRAGHKMDYDDENGKVFSTRIRDVYPLPSKHYLFYLFDYGASWIFKISKTRKALREPLDGVEYPRVVLETGEKPVQYPNRDEDYFDYDEDE